MERTREGTRKSFLDRPLGSVVRITPQTVVLALIVLVLVFSRLYDLGNRSYSHDESTHAWEPWKLITGQGYRFDPVYHGPFLYHATAFFFFVFGDTDTTARLPAALLAVVAVLLVWPLRRWLGRAGALFAMLLLTVSPSMMFRGRFIRHDVFVIAPTMAMVIGFFNYLADRKQRWLYLIAGGLALSFCGKANAFVNGAIFGSFFVAYLAVECDGLQPGWPAPHPHRCSGHIRHLGSGGHPLEAQGVAHCCGNLLWHLCPAVYHNVYQWHRFGSGLCRHAGLLDLAAGGQAWVAAVVLLYLP
jgi:hypothetical protein